MQQHFQIVLLHTFLKDCFIFDHFDRFEFLHEMLFIIRLIEINSYSAVLSKPNLYVKLILFILLNQKKKVKLSEFGLEIFILFCSNLFFKKTADYL